MTAAIVRADARHLPLPDASVDLIVTSPPYYALRDYRDGDASLAGQIGAEPTPREYVAALLECTREWMRVLKPEGSLFVNLGDTYGRGTRSREARAQALHDRRARGIDRGLLGDNLPAGTPPKSLMLLPELYRVGAVYDLGLIARAVIIWSKINGMPESVTDRVRRSHEDWVHLTKEPRYYSAVDEIRETHTRIWGGAPNGGNTYAAMKAPGAKDSNLVAAMPNPLGKLPGSVWEVADGDSLVRIVLRAVEAGELTIDEAERILAGPEGTASASAPPSVWTVATQPLRVPHHIAHARCCGGLKREGCEDGLDHYAAYPMDLPRRIILGWSPPGICTACGEGRRPVVHRNRLNTRPLLASPAHLAAHEGDDRRSFSRGETTASITGYACACPTPDAPTRPSVVVDPFGGTGTSAVVASVHGRHGISVDLSHDYARLAQWRTTDPGERARALGVPKPPPVTSGQIDMFGEPA